VTLVSNNADVEWILPEAPCVCGTPAWSETFDSYIALSTAEWPGNMGSTMCRSRAFDRERKSKP
jgi:hypothetical protein